MSFVLGLNTLMFDFVGAIFCAFAIIPKLAYLLSMSFLGILDVLQLLVRKLAGLDVYFVDGVAQSGDIVYQFIRGILFGDYPVLQDVFIGLIILGAILLFLTTIIAIIRNEYTTEKDGNSKGKIIGKSIKSIIFAGLVPIITLFGIYLCNIVLVAVDKATTSTSSAECVLDTDLLVPGSIVYNFGTVDETENTAETIKTYINYNVFGIVIPTTTTPISGMVFKLSAYTCNRVRVTEGQAVKLTPNSTVNGMAELLQTGHATNFNGLFTAEESDYSKRVEIIANKIDTAFADHVVIKTGDNGLVYLDYSSEYLRSNNVSELDPFGALQGWEYTNLDRFNVTEVWYYYDLWQFNFVVCLGAIIMMVALLINVIFGLMKRIVEMVILFICLPPLLGIMPLDNEKAYNSWRSQFIKKALMAYGAIAGINLVFLVLPFINEISFFDNPFLDYMVSTLFMIVGLTFIKSFIGTISDWVGGENAEAVGGSVAKEVGSTVAKAGLMAAALAAPAAIGGKAMAGSLIKGGKSAINLATRGYRIKQENKARDEKKQAAAAAMADEDMFQDYQNYFDASRGGTNKTVVDRELQQNSRYKNLKNSKIQAEREEYEKILTQKIREKYNTEVASGNFSNMGGIVTDEQSFLNKKQSYQMANEATLSSLDEYKHVDKTSMTPISKTEAEFQQNITQKGTKRGVVGGMAKMFIGRPALSFGKDAVMTVKDFAVNDMLGTITSNEFNKGLGDNYTIKFANKLIGRNQKSLDRQKEEKQKYSEALAQLKRQKQAEEELNKGL